MRFIRRDRSSVFYVTGELPEQDYAQVIEEQIAEVETPEGDEQLRELFERHNACDHQAAF